MRGQWLLSIVILLSSAISAVSQTGVTIYRDDVGVGHVYSNSEVSVYYGLGRLHARDKPLKTMFNLTMSSGKLARVLGKGTGDQFLRSDRKVAGYRMVQQAQQLYNSYTDPEGAKIKALIDAYVKGIRDELTQARVTALATHFASIPAGNWPGSYGYLISSDPSVYQRLLGRANDTNSLTRLENWEPIAWALYGLGKVIAGLPDIQFQKGMATFGSCSWAVTPWGSDPVSGTGGLYIHEDAQGGIGIDHMVRIKSTNAGDKLDAFGFTFEGLPFILGGFANNIAWGTYFIDIDDVDHYNYDLYYRSTAHVWEYGGEDGVFRTLQTTATTLYYYENNSIQPHTTINYYLDHTSSAPGTTTLWVAAPDPLPTINTEDATLEVSRIASLEPGPENKKWDLPRLLYRINKADKAQVFVDALADLKSMHPLGFPVGSDYSTTASKWQLININHGRVPVRPNDIVDSVLGYRYKYGAPLDMSGSGSAYKWATHQGKMFYDLDKFPHILAHEPSLGTASVKTTIKFLASSNTSIQWALGREWLFPVMRDPYWEEPGLSTWHWGFVQPSYGTQNMHGTRWQFPPDDWDYAKHPASEGWWRYLAWIYPQRATCLASYRNMNAWQNQTEIWPGGYCMKQDWAINRLIDAYGPFTSHIPSGISDTEIKGYMNDQTNPLPHHLARMEGGSWFLDLKGQVTEPRMPEKQALLQDFEVWSLEGADASRPDEIPARWFVFWYYFKEENGAANPYFEFPSYHHFPLASGDPLIKSLANQALEKTLDFMDLNPTTKLSQIFFVAAPFFPQTEYATTGTKQGLRRAFFHDYYWKVPPSQVNPRRQVVVGSSHPIQVKLRRTVSQNHEVHFMTTHISTEYWKLPEWGGSTGPNALFFSGLQKWADCQIYKLPMTETEVQNLNHPRYTFTYP